MAAFRELNAFVKFEDIEQSAQLRTRRWGCGKLRMNPLEGLTHRFKPNARLAVRAIQ
ncbi:MAG: hypothetical protein H7A46_21245 [Verrucomicrobiales bacterium]|nr:hypothetical protein [Verrucomicrobiales bacterium]